MEEQPPRTDNLSRSNQLVECISEFERGSGKVVADVDVDDVLRDTLAILSAARRGDDEAIDVLLAHADRQRVLNVLTEIFLGLIEACDVDAGAWLAAEQAKTLEAS